MEEWKKDILILIAEDDDDQYELTSSALGDLRAANCLRRVVDGEELLDYLLRRGDYKNPSLSPRPNLILLDLNMPRKDGREALKEIKAHPELRQIPITVLTVSQDERDISKMYSLGANSYIIKPLRYSQFQESMKALEVYWFKIAQIPRII